jgi:hypothetical protein
MDTGAPRPAVNSDGHTLLCAYVVNSTVAPAGRVALLKFETTLQYKFGYPNDEALQGHSLYRFGLKPYGFFVVENSPHRPGIYSRFQHWIITFHDETLEVIAMRGIVIGQTQLSPDKAVFEQRSGNSGVFVR